MNLTEKQRATEVAPCLAIPARHHGPQSRLRLLVAQHLLDECSDYQ